MLTGKKIALFAMGRIGKIIFSGTAALTLSETQNEKSIFDNDLLKIVEPADYSILVKEYRKVQRKYNPEKDVFVGKTK